jgi:tape measure domain-containing protein
VAAQELGVEAYLSAVDKNFQSAMNMAVQSLTEVANANQSMATRSNSANASTEASSHRLTSGFMSMVTAMGAVAVAAKAFDVVKNAIGGAVARYDTLNNSARTFNNMGFGAKEVGSAMNGLKQSILGLPTPLDQAVKGVQMIAASTGDLGQSQKVYSALNDSIIGFGGSTADVNNAVIQLSQAFANGKVDGMTWISMMNSNMGPVLNAIAKKMGITTAALKDGLSSGKISVQDFQNALIDLDKNGGGGLKSLHNIALDATSGISTSIENAKTAMVRGLTDVLKSTDKALKSNDLPTISQIIVSAGNSISSAFSKIAAAMPKVISAIAPVLKALQPMAPVLKAVAAGFIALGVVALLAPRIAPVITVFGALFGVLKKTTGLFGGLGSRIGGLFKKLTGIGYAGKHAGGGLTEAGEGSKKAGKGASMSAPQILSMGAAIMMAAVGAAILVASFALLVSQVTKLAKVGPMGAIAFIAVAAGMAAVIGVMGIVGKMLGDMGPKAAIAYAGMALLVGAFALLTYAVTGLAQTGKQGTDALTTLTIAIVGIVAVMGIFAPVFQACIPGLLAFGAAIIMVGVGVAIAAAGLALLVVAFTGLVNAISGLASQGPVAIGVIIALTAGIAAMVAVLAVFGPLLTISAVGLLAFGAALLMAGVGIGIAAAGIAMLVNAISNLLSTNTVLGQIISDVWNGIKTVISEVAKTVGPIVSAGFGAMKGIATGIMNALKGVISGVWSAIKGC